MKPMFSLLLVALLLSCSTPENTIQVDPTEERMVGTIHIEKECGALIHAKAGKNMLVIFPDNLDEKYHVEGMKIRFYFKNSSIPVPANCSARARGNVEEVTLLR